MTPKQKFIYEYLDKKMKGHQLPYGMEYLNLLSKRTTEAEKRWKEKNKRK